MIKFGAFIFTGAGVVGAMWIFASTVAAIINILTGNTDNINVETYRTIYLFAVPAMIGGIGLWIGMNVQKETQ